VVTKDIQTSAKRITMHLLDKCSLGDGRGQYLNNPFQKMNVYCLDTCNMLQIQQASHTRYGDNKNLTDAYYGTGTAITLAVS
jgi:hypothetical protein